MLKDVIKVVGETENGSLMVEIKGVGETLIVPSVYHDPKERILLLSYEEFHGLLKELEARNG